MCFYILNRNIVDIHDVYAFNEQTHRGSLRSSWGPPLQMRGLPCELSAVCLLVELCFLNRVEPSFLLVEFIFCAEMSADIYIYLSALWTISTVVIVIHGS